MGTCTGSDVPDRLFSCHSSSQTQHFSPSSPSLPLVHAVPCVSQPSAALSNLWLQSLTVLDSSWLLPWVDFFTSPAHTLHPAGVIPWPECANQASLLLLTHTHSHLTMLASLLRSVLPADSTFQLETK